MSELQLIYERLDQACCPEEVFGDAADISANFKLLARACHPDFHPGDPLAKKAFQKLNSLKVVAEERVKAGEWGKKIPLPHCTPVKIGAYDVNRDPQIGDIADVYRVRGADAYVKVARSHNDNDLIRAEAEALKVLEGVKPPICEGIPKLRSTFQIDGLRKREVNVILGFPDFISLLNVRGKMDVDARTSVWIFKRLLSVLSWVHHFKMIHGAILPPHVLVYPDNDGRSGFDPRKHTVRVIDWCYSVDYKKRTRLSAWVPAWKDHYAPELLNKTGIGPSSDIYMAAKLIRYLCGKLPPAMETVLNRCLDPNPKKRYQKAGHVFDDWMKAAVMEFGSPKWHEFNLP